MSKERVVAGSPLSVPVPHRLAQNESLSTGLNLMRGVSAQMVLVGHTVLFVFYPVPSLGHSYVGYMASFGVVVFFILSGYLITASASRTMDEGGGFTEFFVARFSRIYTALVPALILIAALDLYYIELHGVAAHWNNATITMKHWIGSLFMLQSGPAMNGVHNIFPLGGSAFGSGRPLWTLSFEWWLYMSFGMIFFLRERLFRPVPLLVFSVVSYVPISNMYSFSTYAGGLTAVWVIGSLLFVTSGAWGSLPRRATFISFIIAWSLVAMDVALHFAKGVKFNVYDLNFMTLVSVAIGLSMIVSMHTNWRPWVDRAARHLSAASYTLYLIHYSIIYFSLPLIADYHPALQVLGLIVACNVTAALIAAFTEQKHMRVREFILTKTKEPAA